MPIIDDTQKWIINIDASAASKVQYNLIIFLNYTNTFLRLSLYR